MGCEKDIEESRRRHSFGESSGDPAIRMVLHAWYRMLGTVSHAASPAIKLFLGFSGSPLECQSRASFQTMQLIDRRIGANEALDTGARRSRRLARSAKLRVSAPAWSRRREEEMKSAEAKVGKLWRSMGVGLPDRLLSPGQTGMVHGSAFRHALRV